MKHGLGAYCVQSHVLGIVQEGLTAGCCHVALAVWCGVGYLGLALTRMQVLRLKRMQAPGGREPLRELDLGNFVEEAALMTLEGCGLGRVDEGQSLQRGSESELQEAEGPGEVGCG